MQPVLIVKSSAVANRLYPNFTIIFQGKKLLKGLYLRNRSRERFLMKSVYKKPFNYCRLPILD